MPLPTFVQTLGVNPPALLRKLDRKRDWGDPTDDLDTRVQLAVKNAFAKDEGNRYSLYLVRSDDDLRRVAVALNGQRSSPTENIDLVAFLLGELPALGVTLHETPGATRCGIANALHRDIEASGAKLEALCRVAMAAGRPAGRCTKSTMTAAVQLAQAEQCHAAVKPSPGCLVAACAGSLPAAPPGGSGPSGASVPK